MPVRRHIAIDLGASGGRVALGTIDDGKLDVEVVHRFPNFGTQLPTGLYWDAIALWREAMEGVRLAAERGPIDSVGVNSWGVDYALLDENGLLMDGVRHYRDPRTDGVMEELFAKVPREEIYRRTGIQFMALNTIFQLIAHDLQAPGLLQRARALLMMPDLFHYWLSGVAVSELTIASTTQLFDPFRRAWDGDLMRSCGIPWHLFGRIVEPGTVLGDLRPELAATKNLENTKVIAPAAHDTASAVAAVPAEEGDSWAYISSGTWSLAGVEESAPFIGDFTLDLNLTNEAGVRGTTRLLKNIVGLWILQECRRAWGNPDFGQIYAEAQEATGMAAIDPDDPRFLQPSDKMPGLVQAYCKEKGLPEPQSRGEIARCILEGLANKSAEVLRQLERVTRKEIATVHIVGGGSQIDFLNQLIANASRKRVVAGPVDATLMGNLLIQAEACGNIQAGCIREVVRNSERPTVFNPL